MFSFNQLGNLGELGNQMFQYAAIKGMSEKHNREFMIAPKNVFGKFYYKRLRSNIDDCFDIKCNRNISTFNLKQEKHFHFDSDFFENPPETDLDMAGFFQSEKWFKHIEKEIKKDFTFKACFSEPSFEIKNNFTKKVIAIHVRRTDFTTNTNHCSQEIDYYKKSLEYLPKDYDVLIFSDEPEWCKEQEIFSDDRFYVSEGDNPYVDMCLMSMCDYIVIANSSFSWWAAYLSEAEVIIAPSLWFPKSNPLSAKDIYCENWVII